MIKNNKATILAILFIAIVWPLMAVRAENEEKLRLQHAADEVNIARQAFLVSTNEIEKAAPE